MHQAPSGRARGLNNHRLAVPAATVTASSSSCPAPGSTSSTTTVKGLSGRPGQRAPRRRACRAADTDPPEQSPLVAVRARAQCRGRADGERPTQTGPMAPALSRLQRLTRLRAPHAAAAPRPDRRQTQPAGSRPCAGGHAAEARGVAAMAARALAAACTQHITSAPPPQPRPHTPSAPARWPGRRRRRRRARWAAA